MISAGLARAALKICELTVNVATVKRMAAPVIKGRILILILQA